MCRKQVAALILSLVLASLTGYSSEALSTFGVSNTKPPPTAAPTPPPGQSRQVILRMCKRQAVAVLSVVIVGWLNVQPTNGFGISSFGKANTDAPKPATTTVSPAMRILSRITTWTRYQAAAAILSLLLTTWPSSTEALTTFGKTATQTPKVATTPAPARQCNRQPECAGISGSSCVRTQSDPVTRCLCGENQPPVNGQCDAQHKFLYHACSNSDECNVDLVCATPNITGTAPLHLRVYAPTDKICLCDTENGYVEKDHACSDADILKTSLFAIFVVSCIRKILAY
ncbi:unnamed protein product [Arctia plantaginis]|uniref:Uncharacterized protein n=1 Tax=Arctia plantaginis TaxID=874455 RepID=A0A8S1B410_ARCPL|nr:unnamed protein product [Arctia plantaginis]